MNINKVYIENFKIFKGSFELTLNKGVNILVGNNEVGKSTIIEAIHLVLTGLYNGKYLKNELTQYIFNCEVVNEYIKQKQFLSLLAAAVLAAAATSFCGPIGFIGMATPHLARGFFNSDNQRVLIPASLLSGALLALVAGLLSQGLWGMPSLPLNAVASLMGAPVVIWVLLPKIHR